MNQLRWNERGMDTVHDENAIKGFFGEYRWLSNYHECPVEFEKMMFRSSEAAYQGAKTLDLNDRERFKLMGAGKSKIEGQKVVMREDWNDVKHQVMLDILMDKFTRNPDLRQKLIETGGRWLEETNWWHDVYWGVCDGKGENHLGKLLMMVRSKIKLNL